ncbi:hypothetical protein [Kiloniella sp.]|uniref:hypothetical protein n=1 Tax=Kiloniella sp. TaxID=1938587 RepID=UPI003B01A2D1
MKNPKIQKKNPLKAISGTIDEFSYNLCKIRGNDNPGVGMRLFVEEGIASFGENQQRFQEMSDKLLDTLVLMSDTILTMRSEQTLLMNTLEDVLKERSNKDSES